MNLRLSSAEIGRLQHAQTVLLSPLDYATPELWAAASCDAVRALVGGHEASLFRAGEGAELWFTTMDGPVVGDFLSRYAGIDPVSARVVARGIECGCAWDVVDRDEFHRSEFYHDFAKPHRLHDGMGLRIPAGPGSHLWLTVQHHRPRPEPDVRRRVSLMRLLLPAFKAGSRLAGSLPVREAQLSRLLDHLPQPMVVASLDGRVLHRNQAMARLLGDATDGAVANAVAELLRALVALRSREETAPEGLVREVDAGGRRHRMTGTFAGEGTLGPQPVLLVQAHAQGPAVPPADELRRRFGLTRREVEVALLLNERRTNPEIARALHISPHTAERHTERVLGKLEVRSRLQVPDRLRE